MLRTCWFSSGSTRCAGRIKQSLACCLLTGRPCVGSWSRAQCWPLCSPASHRSSPMGRTVTATVTSGLCVPAIHVSSAALCAGIWGLLPSIHQPRKRGEAWCHLSLGGIGFTSWENEAWNRNSFQKEKGKLFLSEQKSLACFTCCLF